MLQVTKYELLRKVPLFVVVAVLKLIRRVRIRTYGNDHQIIIAFSLEASIGCSRRIFHIFYGSPPQPPISQHTNVVRDPIEKCYQNRSFLFAHSGLKEPFFPGLR